MITPQTQHTELAAQIGLTGSLWLKREDLHPLGSHKGRSIPVMMEKYLAQGRNKFVISSSGNAALAASHYFQELGTRNQELQLTVFVGKNVEVNKLALLRQGYEGQNNFNKVEVLQVERPKQEAIRFAKEFGAVNLRQSTDDTALLGYESLAEELLEISDLQAVFIPTSSGTTAQALGDYFLQNCKTSPQIHIVQTENCHPMAEMVNDQYLTINSTIRSIATAIVDKVAYRKEKLAEVIKKTHGGAWIASNEEIKSAIKIFQENINEHISPNAALSLVGLQQALAFDLDFEGSVVLLITGF